MDLPLALVAPNDDPAATQRASKQVQRSQRTHNEARRAADRRWAIRRQVQRQIAREEQLRARQAGVVSLPEQQIAQRESAFTDRVRAHLHTLQEAYERGDGLHPDTGQYRDEERLPASRRGALIAWRKGYRVTPDGRFWNPKGIELHPATTIQVVAGIKHHRRYTDQKRRAPQPVLAFGPQLLAALCFFGPRALRDGLCVWALDRNKRNWCKDNLVLLTRSEVRQRSRDPKALAPYRAPQIAARRSNGTLRGRKLTPERVQAIRQLVDLGWPYQRIAESLAARGVLLSLATIRRVNKGLLWA